jgi:signal transduction histidine kinase/CheY-like chemotaxis protein
VDHIYRFERVACCTIFIANGIRLLLSSDNFDSKMNILCLIRLIMSGSFVYLVNKTWELELKWKTLVAHLMSELILNINLYYAYYTFSSDREYFIIVAIGVLMQFQYRLSSSVSQGIFFTVKYSVTMGLFKYFSGVSRLDAPMHFISCVMVAFTLIDFNLETTRGIDRIRAYKRLEKISKELEGILLSIPEGLLAIDSDLNILHHNSCLLEQFHINTIRDFVDNSQEVQIYQGMGYLEEPMESNLYQEILRVLQLDTSESVTIGIVKERDLLYEFRAKKWRTDRDILIITSRDVSDINNLNQEKRENYFKTILLRSVSHELRTPTSCIQNFAEQIKESENLSPKSAKKTDMIITCSKHLLFLINDLLDFSRFMSGVFKINKKDFNIREVLTQCFESIQIQASNKQVFTSLVIDPLIPKSGFNDEIRLSQVIFNLLGNAVKFTSRGSVSMYAYLTFTGRLRISVKDTGIGISPEKRQDLFKPFGKLNSMNPNINPQGCGLGLYISNLLVRAMGGQTIRVKSREWLGSTFTLEIPIKCAEDAELIVPTGSMMIIPKEKIRGEPVYLPDSRIANEKITHLPALLLADDNEFNRILLGEYLNHIGLVYEEARNGQEVVELVKRRENINQPQFRVIILDCEMPILDGWSVSIKLNKMYSKRKIKNLPIIIGHTAHSSDEDLKRCYDSGMKDTIPKPVKLKDFGSIVKHYLDSG